MPEMFATDGRRSVNPVGDESPWNRKQVYCRAMAFPLPLD
jgi:hypothetical protein